MSMLNKRGDGVDVLKSGAPAGLIAFLQWARENGYLHGSTASDYISGCRKVLGSDRNSTEINLRRLDVEGQILEFRATDGLNLSNHSRKLYEQRFRTTLEMYLRWLDGDPEWRTVQRARVTRTSDMGTEFVKEAGKSIQIPEGMALYPLTISKGIQAQLILPKLLSKKDAGMLTTYIEFLAGDES